MPSKSISQQRLFGMAYAYKKGELKDSEVSDAVKDLANSMSLEKLREFAKTPHEDLPYKQQSENSFLTFEDFLFEKGSSTGSKISDAIKNIIFKAPKAQKLQKKINKLKLNKVELQFMKDGVKKEEQEKIQNKITAIDKGIESISSMLDDKYKGNEYVERVISKERIKGEFEVIKYKTGMSDDPKDKQDLKASVKKLQDRMREEDEALKDWKEKNKEDVKRAKEEIERQKGKKNKTEDNDKEETEETDNAKSDKTRNTSNSETDKKNKTSDYKSNKKEPDTTDNSKSDKKEPEKTDNSKSDKEDDDTTDNSKSDKKEHDKKGRRSNENLFLTFEDFLNENIYNI